MSSLKISIVMACYNRRDQLKITLNSIALSKHKNFEIIIVDDLSDESQRIDDIVKDFHTNHGFNIRLFRTTKELKTYINPCVPYNIALSQIDTNSDIVIIQNPEVCHIGDVMSYITTHLKLNDYLTFSCYGLANTQQNNDINNILNDKTLNDIMVIEKTIIEKTKEFISSKPNKSGGTYFHTNDPSGWLNNASHFRPYHYLCAMWKSDLVKHGGFDNDYADGLCFDDDDFLKRVEFHGFRTTLPRYELNNPFCIHLWHPKIKQLDLGKEKWNINNQVFKKKMCLLGLNEQRGHLKPFYL